MRLLLEKLGYRKRNGHWFHKTSKLIFLGDLIDRGPEQIETVELVQNLERNGLALCLMGNHEFNAVGFATEAPESSGEFIRKHNSRNIGQHEKFLEEYANKSASYKDTIKWMAGLPVWYESKNVRAVHACWHRESQNQLGDLLTENHRPKDINFFVESGINNSKLFSARENLLSGLELKLPSGKHFFDFYGVKRTKIRVNWWTRDQKTYRDSAVISNSQKHNIPNVQLINPSPYYDETICFFGHYWMSGIPLIKHPRAICLDYSVALKSGLLCGYRFKNERNAIQENLVWQKKL